MTERCKRDLAFLQRVSALVYPVWTTIFLTSTDWARVAKEVSRIPGMKTNCGRRATPRNFKQLHIGRLTAVNSGTEDQDVCDALNAPEERKSRFREKHDWLAGPVVQDDNRWTDAASTEAMPEGMAEEIETKLRRKYNTLDVEVV